VNEPSCFDANIKEVLELKVRLPRKKLYAPNIDIVVVEGGFPYVFQPKVLASASFSVSEYYEDGWNESENQDVTRRATAASGEGGSKNKEEDSEKPLPQKQNMAAKAISKYDGEENEQKLEDEFTKLMQSLKKIVLIRKQEENKMLQSR
jgi:hypothetical protein